MADLAERIPMERGEGVELLTLFADAPPDALAQNSAGTRLCV